MKIHNLPDAELLRDLIAYGPLSGTLTWRGSGKDATCDTGRYRGVAMEFGRFQAHRIAWKIMTGEDPQLIDHIDGDGCNNAFANLRSVTQSVNLRNRALGSNNTSGHTGVSWCKRRQRWRVGIKINQRRIELGIFVNKDDAIRARLAAEKRYDFMPVTRSVQHGK